MDLEHGAFHLVLERLQGVGRVRSGEALRRCHAPFLERSRTLLDRSITGATETARDTLDAAVRPDSALHVGH
jgi:hypothetical protein